MVFASSAKIFGRALALLATAPAATAALPSDASAQTFRGTVAGLEQAAPGDLHPFRAESTYVQPLTPIGYSPPGVTAPILPPIPIEGSYRDRRTAGPDAYGELGLRFGSVVVLPSVDLGVGVVWDRNPPGDVTLPITPRLLATADWGTVTAALDLSATFDAAAEPPASILSAASATLSLDAALGPVWRGSLDIAYGFAPLRPGDAALPVGYDRLPGVHTASVDAAVSGPVGPTETTVSFSLDRSRYEDVSVGSVWVSQAERNFLVAAGSLRVASAAGTLFRPFVEVTAGRRFYDIPVDALAAERNGTFADGRIGVLYDSAPVLTAEASVGYRFDRPDDPAVAPASGIVLGSSATWSPREELRLTIAGSIDVAAASSSTTAPTSSRDVSVRLEYDLRDNILVAGFADYGAERAAGVTMLSSAQIGAEASWQPTRWVVLSARYAHRWNWAVGAPAGDDSHEFLLTARLQR